MKISEYSALDATGLAELIRKKEVNPMEVLETAIEALEQVNPTLNAVVDRTYEYAKAQIAEGIDRRAPFCGVPIVVKDEGELLAGIRGTVGSRLSGDGIYIPQDSELGVRIKKAGAIILATSACPEFCWNNSTETLRHGITRNPWNLELTPGGSSGGTAALVASGVVPMGHGSDGGGSIRMPASACGLVGLKPTRFRIPTGPFGGDPGQAVEFVMTRSLRDTAIMLDAVEGPDAGCYGAAVRPTEPYGELVKKDPGKLKIAYMLHLPYGVPYESEGCVKAVKSTVALLEELGHECVEAYPPLDIHYHVPRILVQAVGTNSWIESVAARSGLPITEEYLEPLVFRAYQEARQITLREYQEAKNELVRVMRAVGEFMKDYDVLICPTMGIRQPEAGLHNPYCDPSMTVEEWVLDRRRCSGGTAMCNVSGQPSITIPLEISEEGLPIGIEIDGRVGEDGVVLQLAGQLERARPWKDRRPGIYAE